MARGFGMEIAGILGILNSAGAKGTGEIENLLRKEYEENVDKYRPLIQALSRVIPELVDDLIPPLVGLFQAANRLTKNEALQAQARIFRDAKVQRRKELFDAFMKADFTREEALLLVLQEMASSQNSWAAIRQASLKSKKE